jgi:flagellar basal-body rod modification protein FlgD
MTTISSINPFMNSLAGSTTGIESAMGRDAFLRMLMVQLQYQDPLDPADSQEFSSQLAQFSQLEELQAMNESLNASLSTETLLTQSITNTLATTLIGKTVVADTAAAYLSDGEATFHFNLSDAASDASLKIYDASGALVRTIELSDLPQGDNSYTWNGHDQNGNACDTGAYTFTVTATDVEGESVTVSPFIEGTITAVRYENGMAVLLIGDIELNLSDVTEIRDSESGGSSEFTPPWFPTI